VTADTSLAEQADEAADVNLCLQDFGRVTGVDLNG
jgi:hypothetical protein